MLTPAAPQVEDGAGVTCPPSLSAADGPHKGGRLRSTTPLTLYVLNRSAFSFRFAPHVPCCRLHGRIRGGAWCPTSRQFFRPLPCWGLRYHRHGCNASHISLQNVLHLARNLPRQIQVLHGLETGRRFGSSSRDLFRRADSPAGSCAAAGLGYHVVTIDGKTSDAWDAVSNVDILGVEFGGDLSTVIR